MKHRPKKHGMRRKDQRVTRWLVEQHAKQHPGLALPPGERVDARLPKNGVQSTNFFEDTFSSKKPGGNA